jgi:hypothetical protein
MKQFRITVTWAAPYEESELEYYNSPEEYVKDMMELHRDNTIKLMDDIIYYLTDDPEISIVVEEI